MDIPHLFPFSSIVPSSLVVKLFESIATLPSGKGLQNRKNEIYIVLKDTVQEFDLSNLCTSCTGSIASDTLSHLVIV